MRNSTIVASIALLAFSAYWASGADPAGSWKSIPLIEGGKVAPGWGHVGYGALVVDGETLRTDADERGLGLLVYTKERLGNCRIRVVYRCKDAKSNAGVFIRMDEGILNWVDKPSLAVKREANGKLSPAMLEKMKEASETEQGAWYAVHHGYEVQIMDSADAMHRTGAIYSLAPAVAVPAKSADAWRTMVITLAGSRVRVELDGTQVSQLDTEAKDNPPRKNWTGPRRDAKRPAARYIGLQVHDPGDVVYFKEISVQPLSMQP